MNNLQRANFTEARGLFKNSVHDAFGGAPMMTTMDDAGIGSGLAFLKGELEKHDPKLYEPLTNVTWQRDIVAKTGGGFVQFTSNMFTNYATTGATTDAFIGGQTNDIPIIQANISKEVYDVLTWSNILRIPFIDQQFLKTASRSLDDLLDTGIKLNYNKALDWLVYMGYENENLPGIFTNPYVFAEMAPTGASGQTEWKTKTHDEILDDINTLLVWTWETSEYDITGMANHVLIPPLQYAYLVSRKVSEAGNVSILKYLEENNIARAQGVDLKIFPSRWGYGTGVGGTDRMVAYRNDEGKINFDLPVPLRRVMTNPAVDQMAYLTAYVAQMGQVKFLYQQTIRYMDGI